MADIFNDFPIRAPRERVFDAVSTPEGLNTWWSLTCKGRPAEGAIYELGFGPEYQWRATVGQCVAPSAFELQITEADGDWVGTRVLFMLEARGESTQVHFSHIGWPVPNAHWRISCHCWALYLRLLRRYVEFGEVVPYEQRLDV